MLSNTTRCHLSHLMPGSRYIARVRARAQQAKGFSGPFSEWSTDVSWETPEGSVGWSGAMQGWEGWGMWFDTMLAEHHGVAVSSHCFLLGSPRTGILHLASSRVFGISIPLDRPCSRRPRQRLSLHFSCHLAYSDLLCRPGTHSAQEPSLPLQWCKSSDVQLGSEESDHHLCHLWLVLQGHSSIRVCDLPMAECPNLSH